MRMITSLFILLFSYAAWSDTPEATLNRTTIPAKGKQDAILNVTRFGRYSITAQSKQGLAIQLVDRMAGPGPVAGTAGSSDGRLDLFLDRGEYKIVVYGHPKGTGSGTLQVHPFLDRNAPRPPLLIDLKMIHDSLNDFEQRSYWIRIERKQAVFFEAAGRNLADLRLWKDGNWLVDASPQTTVTQPKTGQPLLNCVLTTELDPGLYLLIAYGGSSQPWAEESGDHPFHLRSGIRKLGEAGRQRFVMSPFGIDRWLVPGNATYVRIELPEARFASLQVGSYAEPNPVSNGPVQTITKNSVPPAAEIQTSADPKTLQLITVLAAPEQPYVLQQFQLRTEYSFQRDGAHWLSTIHSGNPGDSIDATAIVVRYNNRSIPQSTPFLAKTIEIDASNGWRRRFNLLDPLTLFVQIKSAGKYQLNAEGVEARYRFVPFLLSPPPNYKPADYRSNGSIWNLDPGFYELEVTPVKKGILNLEIRPSGLLDSMLQAIGLESKTERASVRAAVRFESVKLSLDDNYTVFLNQQPEVKAGVILRSLPLDLTEPLFLSLQPNESATLSAKITESGKLTAITETGAHLEMCVAGGSWQTEIALPPGQLVITVRNTGNETAQSSLSFEPTRLLAETPLPALPDTSLTTLPQFKSVNETEAQFFDIKRDGTETFLVAAEKPALYRLETTGLLATNGTFRTRTVANFATEKENGTGRNFLLQQYLREGDYQVSVRTQGQSEGHTGIRLTRSEPLNGGSLADRRPARISLPAGQAVLYEFKIDKPGRYRVRSFGVGTTFRCRLEDSDGWPIEIPNIKADLERDFDPGDYRLMLMPEPVPSRRITLLEHIKDPEQLEGHGPHPIGLDRQTHHVWQESPAKEERIPDVWRFTVPAPLDATITLTGEMQADLLRVGSAGKVAFVPPGRGWKGHLEPGEYQLQVTCLRRNNHAEYMLLIHPDQLVSGLERDVTLPLEIPVSIGKYAMVQISSFGSVDVLARLRDMDGNVIAKSDDRADDWNFEIATAPAPGLYQLQVDAVDGTSGATKIAMKMPEEKLEASLQLPASFEVVPDENIHIYPLQIPLKAEVIAFHTASTETVGTSLDAFIEGRWQTIGTSVSPSAHLEIPVVPGTLCRARLWSVDQRGTPVKFSAVAITPPHVTEQELQRGVTLPSTGIVTITNITAGMFLIGDVSWSTSRHHPLVPSVRGLVSATGDFLWLSGRPNTIVKAVRVVLPAGIETGLALFDEPSTVDIVTPETGPVVAIARSATGQPGIGIVSRQAGSVLVPDRMAVAKKAAATVSMTSDRAAIALWQATYSPDPGETRVIHFGFPEPAVRQLELGPYSSTVQGIVAESLQLPAGWKRLKIALGSSLVAALTDGDNILSIHWQGNEPFEESIDTQGGRVLILHLRDAPDRYSIEALPITDDVIPARITADQPFTSKYSTTGIARFSIPQMQGPSVLHIRGAVKEAVLVSTGGKISRGPDVPLPAAGGTLLLNHGAGFILGWLEPGGIWGSKTATQPINLTPPAIVPLYGKEQAVRIRITDPSLLSVRTTDPVISRLQRTDRDPEVDVHESGCVLDTYVTEGQAFITLRALADDLSGNAEITVTPVTNIVEGLQAAVVLAAGSTRLFSFFVAQAGRVGIGVRSDSDLAEATLMDSSGSVIGKGVVQMPELKTGTYLLAVHAPTDSGPIQIQPALAGVQLPDSRPPEDVIRNYLASSTPVVPGASIQLTSPAAKNYQPEPDQNPDEYDSYEYDGDSE